jgi:hypothetical protein
MNEAQGWPHEPTGRGVPHVLGRHSVSPFNFLPDVTEGFDFPRPLALIDSTVRKAIYTAGVRPTVSDVLKISEILAELGVRDESLNMWWWGEGQPDQLEYDVVRALGVERFGFRINVFSDTVVGDGRSPAAFMRSTVDMLAEAGVTAVAPGLLQAPDADAARRQADEFSTLGEYAASAGLSWTVTIANCARRDFDAMVAASNVAISAGAARIDLMDSTSALSPEAMKLFVRTYRTRLAAPVPTTMHAHDDFGMATAGTIAAVTAGASPDVSLNGVSYRSGFAALEEVALALDVLYGLDTGIRLDRLQWASERLAQIMDFAVHPLKPVVGAHQFLRDSPGEIMAMLANGTGFPPPGQSVAPALTGGCMQWVWGKQGNLSLLHAIAGSLGLVLPDEYAHEARNELDRRVAGKVAYPKWVSAEEVEEVIRRLARAAEASVQDAQVFVQG